MKHALYGTAASLIMLTIASANITQHQQTPEALIEFVYSQFKSDNIIMDSYIPETRQMDIYRGPYLKTIEIDMVLRERRNHCIDFHFEIGNDNYDPAEIRGNIEIELISNDGETAIVKSTLNDGRPYHLKWFLEKENNIWYITDAQAEKYYGRFSELCDYADIILENDMKKIKSNPQTVVEYIYSYYVNGLVYLDLKSSKDVFKGKYNETLERMYSFSEEYEYCWDSEMIIGTIDYNMEAIANTIQYETDIQADDIAIVTVSLYEGENRYLADWLLKKYDNSWYVVDLQDRRTGTFFSELCRPI